MLYFYPRKLFEHFRIGYFLPLNFSGVCKTNQKSCFKERETKRLQRLSHVMQKFSKKLKTVARTRLHFCAVLIALQALVITTFFGHILYKGRPSLSFSAGEADSPSQLFCRRRKWSHRKTDKKLDTPCKFTIATEKERNQTPPLNHNFYFTQFHIVNISAQNCWYHSLPMIYTWHLLQVCT